jgi:DNA-directed RNA polymerase subunit alpha
MLETIKTDIKALFLEREDCDAGTVQQLRNGLSQGPTQYKALREAIEAMKAKLPTVATAQQKKWLLKLGIASYFLGRIKDAATYLKQAEGALASFYLGRAQASLHELDEAMKTLERAEKSGYTASQVQLQRANVLRMQRHLKEAKTILGKLTELASHSGEYHYQTGSILLEEGDRPEALKHFERSVELDPNHTGALFQLGYANDLAGNDDDAIKFYERSVSHLPAHLGALLNLGILYEDTNQYSKASACYQRILAAEPTHERARLFLKDSQASETMYYDEEAERKDIKFSQILEVPVTDFELSVRSRNCLKKMNIRTLGDLTRVTEQQLLSSKNFGETSLMEIKEMMQTKGLRLGQALEEGAKYDPRFRPQQPLTEQEQAVLGKPVSDLNLSVRARKCMNKLSITTLGELIQRTPDELLEIKNFGQTSLSEVREKLEQYGLKLRGD